MGEEQPTPMDRYLDGEATEADLRQLEEQLRADPAARESLLLEGFLRVDLAEALGLSTRKALKSVWRAGGGWFRVARWTAAALALVAVGGWAMSWRLHGQLREADRGIAALENRIRLLEGEGKQTPASMAADDYPKVATKRGLLLALADGQAGARQLNVNATVPMSRRLWTCPWGAAEFQCDRNSWVGIDRNTVASLSETSGERHIRLERGILYVTNSSATRRPTVIQTSQAIVRLTQGQVAVVASGHDTTVETAEGSVEVIPAGSSAAPLAVRAGHYTVVAPGQTPDVKPGRMTWQIKPPDAAARAVAEPT